MEKVVKTDNNPPTGGTKYVLIMNKPLYGLRSSPYRWFIHLRTKLRLRQSRRDICVFYKFGDSAPLIYMVVRVEDLFVAYRGKGFEIVQSALKGYRKGDWEHLSVNKPLTFLGLDAVRNPSGDVEITQKAFISAMKEIDIDTIIQNGKRIISADALRTQYRSVIGSCICMRQTRFDTSYQVTMMATNAPTSVEDPAEIKRMIKSINKLIRHLKLRTVSLKYGDMWPGEKQATLNKLQTLVVFGFSDAGYATLKQYKSQESRISERGESTTKRRSYPLRGVAVRFLQQKNHPHCEKRNQC